MHNLYTTHRFFFYTFIKDQASSPNLRSFTIKFNAKRHLLPVIALVRLILHLDTLNPKFFIPIERDDQLSMSSMRFFPGTRFMHFHSKGI